MKLSFKLVTTFCAGLFLLTATLAQTTTYPVVVKHDAGEARIPQRPQRIVVLGAISLEVALALGLQPIGYGSNPPYIPENAEVGKPIESIPAYAKLIKTNPVMVGSSSNPSLEAIKASNADLIISDARFTELNTKLSEISPTLAFNFSSLGSSQRALDALGLATGRATRVAEVKRNLERTVAVNKALLKDVVAKSKRMNIFFVTTDSVFRGGVASDTGRQMVSLGFEVVGVSKDSNLDKVSLESLPLQRANIGLIIMSAIAPEARKTQVLSLLKKSSITRLVRYDLRADRLITGPISEPLLLDEYTKLLRN
jgi:ABC-type Fe3+-hydroxamate transport system substrate-binding protein